MPAQQIIDVSRMRGHIAEACQQEARTEGLRRRVQAGCRRCRPTMPASELDAWCDRVVESIRLYIASTADLIEETVAAASREGVAEQLRPVFETAMAYADERVDLIPDELGLVGLLDDAYLIHGLLQEMSNRHRSLTGRPLVPETCFELSQRVRRLIGEPTATRLDVAIVAFARHQDVRATVDRLIGEVGDRGLTMTLPATIAFPPHDDPIEELPELDLGTIAT